MEINEKLFLQCLDELRLQQASKQNLKNYYDGKHDILKTYRMNTSQSNMKLVFNFPKKFVTSMTGYSLGNPVNYVSKSGDKDIVNAIDFNMSYWEKSHNQKLSKYADIFGESFEINYITKDGLFHSMVTTPLEMYVVDDGTPEQNVIVAVHSFKRKFDDTQYMDVYVDDKILHYTVNGQSLQLLSTDQHIFNSVPINVCVATDEKDSIFQDIIPIFRT